jgi:hypothetical protein
MFFSCFHLPPSNIHSTNPTNAYSCTRRVYIGANTGGAITQYFASSTVHFINIGVKNQQMQQLFIQLCMVAPTFFDVTLPSSRRVPSAFREMLN